MRTDLTEIRATDCRLVRMMAPDEWSKHHPGKWMVEMLYWVPSIAAWVHGWQYIQEGAVCPWLPSKN